MSTRRMQLKSPKVRNHNQFGLLQRFDIECYKCNNFGHLARNCKMKCEAPVEVWRQWEKMAVRKQRDQITHMGKQNFHGYCH